MQVAAVCGFAFTQPVLDVFGRAPDIAITSGATRSDLVVFALAWAALPALVCWLAGAMLGLAWRRARALAHWLTIGTVVAIFVAQELVFTAEWAVALAWTIAALAGAAFAVTAARYDPARLFLSYAGAAPVLFAALFIFSSSVSPVIWGGSTATPVTDIDSDIPVVVFVLDELPTASLLDGHGAIDAQLFPNFARLASRSTWYRNNTTVGTVTQVAVPAIFTGRYPPDANEVPIFDRYPDNIFTLLGGTYEMHVSERVTQLCPANICPPARRGGGLRELLHRSRELWLDRFERPLPTSTNVWNVGGDPLDEERVARVADWLPGVATTPGPRLDLAHVLLPHQPWQYLPSGKHYPDRLDGVLFYAWADDETAIVAKQRHLLQLQYTDRLLGELLDRLDASGQFDESLLIVTADHGVSFHTAQAMRAITDVNEIDIAYTPLFVKLPNQRDSAVDDRNTLTIDVFPTIADVLGVDIPWRVDGQSVLGQPRPTSEKQIVLHDLDPHSGRKGERLTIDGTADLRELLSRPPAVAPGDDLRIFRDGEYGSLVGRSLDDFEIADDASFAATIQDPSRAVDPQSDTLPVYVKARVGTDERVPVALVVGDRIAATTWTHPQFDDPNAWFVIPEQLFEPGRNELSLYVLDGPAAAPALHRIRPR